MLARAKVAKLKDKFKNIDLIETDNTISKNTMSKAWCVTCGTDDFV